MNKEEVIKFSENTKFLNDRKCSIVINRENGLWVKIPNECKEMLCECSENKYTKEMLINNLIDDDDKKYMLEIINILKQMECLNEKDKINKKNRLRDVSFAISNRCNLQCKHCMVNADKCSDKENFTTDEIINALDKIIAANPEVITITGGEPLVRADFIQIIKYLKENFNGKIGLMTNGILINEENVKEIVKCVSSIDISLDGVDEKSCSIIRGKGVFKKVIENIKLLKRYNFNNITTSMVLSANNEPFIEEFFKLNKNLNIKGILRALSFVGQAKKNKELLTKQFFENKSNYINKFIPSSKSEKFHTCSCLAGCRTLTIESDGSIFPCNLFIEGEHKLGNIMNVSKLEDILVHDKRVFLSKSLQKYEPDKMEECGKCNVNYFCWSCLHQIVDAKEANIFNERCKAMKRELKAVFD